jgi:hypothetical protein
MQGCKLLRRHPRQDQNSVSVGKTHLLGRRVGLKEDSYSSRYWELRVQIGRVCDLNEKFVRSQPLPPDATRQGGKLILWLGTRGNTVYGSPCVPEN